MDHIKKIVDIKQSNTPINNIMYNNIKNGFVNN